MLLLTACQRCSLKDYQRLMGYLTHAWWGPLFYLHPARTFSCSTMLSSGTKSCAGCITERKQVRDMRADHG